MQGATDELVSHRNGGIAGLALAGACQRWEVMVNGLFDYRQWMRPSHATGWLSLGAFQFYAIILALACLVYGVIL